MESRQKSQVGHLLWPSPAETFSAGQRNLVSWELQANDDTDDFNYSKAAAFLKAEHKALGRERILIETGLWGMLLSLFGLTFFCMKLHWLAVQPSKESAAHASAGGFDLNRASAGIEAVSVKTQESPSWLIVTCWKETFLTAVEQRLVCK